MSRAVLTSLRARDNLVVADAVYPAPVRTRKSICRTDYPETRTLPLGWRV